MKNIRELYLFYIYILQLSDIARHDYKNQFYNIPQLQNNHQNIYVKNIIMAWFILKNLIQL